MRGIRGSGPLGWSTCTLHTPLQLSTRYTLQPAKECAIFSLASLTTATRRTRRDASDCGRYWLQQAACYAYLDNKTLISCAGSSGEDRNNE